MSVLVIRSSKTEGAEPERAGSDPGLLATLCLFTGLTAICGGTELVLSPDGSPIGLPLALLARTPFADFFVPGLLLAGVVGVANAVSGVLVLRRDRLANGAAFVSGAIMSTWIVVEVLLIRHVHWLHGVYLALGTATMTVALLREKHAGRLAATMRSLLRVFVHAVAGWALCGVAMGVLLATTSHAPALVLHALAVPLVFVVVSRSYFGRRGAWPPLACAVAFTLLVAALDLVVVACFVERSLAMFRSFAGTWLPLLLAFGATWASGVSVTRARRTR